MLSIIAMSVLIILVVVAAIVFAVVKEVKLK